MSISRDGIKVAVNATSIDKVRESHGVSMDPPKVKWQWHLGDKAPAVDMFQTVRANGMQWRMRYPEHAPPGARYELIVDDAPLLTPEQNEVLHYERAALVELWRREMDVMDVLLALWDDGGPDPGDAVAQYGGHRYLNYRATVSAYPLTIAIEVTALYKGDSIRRVPFGISSSMTVTQTPAERHSVEARVSIVNDGNDIHLTSIKLPIVDGRASRAPLVKYLRNNPLMAAGRALSSLGTDIGKMGEK